MTSMDNTPDSPAKTPEGYTTQGGNFWTLITPEIWKVLHAVLHVMRHFGITKNELGITSHGLRHQRLNDMYEEIAGVPAPVRQLEALKQGLPLVEGEPDRVLKARSRTTSTAGHARLGITTAYSGSARSVKQAIRKMTKAEIAERVRLVPATEATTSEDCEPASM